ncbi:sulfite exporter TauE/SafE family protein [Paraburkholderia fungorum]|uniref:sulfite exporter TauE/SafE family protein n=1 Tax=Paraburkholderia fungorum TaxID=134537 RepID=UPI000A8DF1D7|nr:sulfite exporter TauE/SafE family protein [Paraburkholderia fungorum]USX04274.1 sulfite exporter TauE/SafE family protein [Paraburkholderia fungorum]
MTGAQAAMDLGYTLWLFVVSLGASALGGVLGMASGIFIVPILTMFGHLDIHIAIGASIVSVIACSCGGAAPFLRGRLTNVRLAVVLETATTLGALSGVLLSGLIPVPVLFFIFAVILLLSAQQMLARRADPVISHGTAVPGAQSWGAALRLDSSYPDRALGRDVDYRVQRVPLGLSLMYGAGLISALLGIGSGVLKIPAMDTALRLPIKVSSATSNFMIGVTATASAGAYFLRGDIVAAIAGPVALGSVVGAVLGARVLTRLSGDRLRVLFVLVLAVLAVQMLLEAFGVHLFGASA